MCGLAGIVGRIGETNRNALRRMNAAMLHRGPDADGFWEAEPDSHGNGPMLAHRRLSILDLSTAGAQPMVDPVTRNAVVFNGEIYNYVELRESLSARGRVTQSSGDTVVLLNVLGLQGEQAIPRLRGMFAFAFWHASERQLILARDPLGIKPLYIAYNPDPRGEWSLVFASEVRAILASGLLGRARLNPAAVASVIWNGFTIAPETAVQGVEAIMPGEYRVFSGSGHEESRRDYWTLADRHDPREKIDLSSEIRKCVRLHLASDVPLSVFLSGGIDSSAIANLAQKESQGSVHTFTLAFEEQDINEGVFARNIAKAIGTEHQEVILTEQHFVDHLDAALDSLDQPSFDGLNSYFMAQAVRDAGFKVALVGAGGDELFGGYTTFRDLPRMQKLARGTRWIPNILREGIARQVSTLLQPASDHFPPQTRWAKLPDMMQSGGDLIDLYQLAYALFLPGTQQQLLGTAVRRTGVVDGLPSAMRTRLLAETRDRSPLTAVSILEQRLFLGERLLRDSDATSMAASIEMRLPLVDSVLFKTVDRVAEHDRYAPVRSKSLLRKIGLVGLDPALFNRPKSGFELPFNRWLRNALGRRIDATLRDQDAVRSAGLDPKGVERLWDAFSRGASGLYWTRIWAIYVLVRWCGRHQVYLQESE